MLRLTLATVLVLGAASVARADTPAPDPDFTEGRRLLDAGDYVAACAKLKMTYEREHTAGKAFNLSVCEEKQGHVARALDWMKSGIAILAANDDRMHGAVERRDELDKRVGRLTIHVGAPDPRIVVRLDGEVAVTTAPVLIDPGVHFVTTSLAGHEDARVEVTGVAGASSDVTAQPGALLGGATPRVAASPPMNGQRIAGIALMSAGGASLIGFAVSAGLVAKTHSSFGTDTGQARLDDASSGRQIEIAEAVLLGLGIAASGAGIAVFATAPHSAAPTVTPVAHVSSDRWLLGVRGAY